MISAAQIATPLAITISMVWLACVIICILKMKYGTVILGVVAAIAQNVGLPPIGGIYILNIIYPLWLLPIYGAIRLAHPESYYAYWFYRNNQNKYIRAVVRYGMMDEYLKLRRKGAETLLGEIELSLYRRGDCIPVLARIAGKKREVGYGAFVEPVAVVLEDRAGFRKDAAIMLTDKERDDASLQFSKEWVDRRGTVLDAATRESLHVISSQRKRSP